MKKGWLALVVCLALALSGCASGTPVYVQSVGSVSAMGGIAPGDRFAGLVVSEHVTEIKKDADKTVEELLVKEGDDVEEGQALFSYDIDQLQLAYDKQVLELEQLHASIAGFKSTIQNLEWERGSASGTERLQYTLEIDSTKIDLREAELKVKTKENEVAKSKELLENATVVSPIKGRVQKISEEGTDQNGESTAYITIQQAGSYRIKGVLGELQRGGITEGSRMSVLSRVSDDRWSGTVTLVDYENPSQGSDMDRYYGMGTDEMTAASKYPFYVELDSMEGLILGQHVYLELETEEDSLGGVPLSMAFICYEDDGSAYVWAENGRKLEKRPVALGQTDDMTGMVEVLEGLSVSDYIAFPDAELCVEGAPTTHDVVTAEPEEVA